MKRRPLRLPSLPPHTRNFIRPCESDTIGSRHYQPCLMSSIAAHAAAGLTVYMCSGATQSGWSRWTVVPFIVLAVAPDLDYFAVWLFSYGADPRFSHSLLLAVGGALLVKLTLFRFFGLSMVESPTRSVCFHVPVHWRSATSTSGVTCRSRWAFWVQYSRSWSLRLAAGGSGSCSAGRYSSSRTGPFF